MSVYNDILNAVQSVVVNLGLSYNSQTIPVVVQKLPRFEERLDTLPVFCICPHEQPEDYQKLGFENAYQVTYLVEIVLISAGNRDLVTNLDTMLDWRETIRNAFRTSTLAGVPAVWKIDLAGEALFDRSKLPVQYDYGGLAIHFTTIE